MKDRVYIVANSEGCIRMTKREPQLYRGEVAVRLTVMIPDENFKNPILEAAADVAPDQVIHSAVGVDVEDSDYEDQK